MEELQDAIEDAQYVNAMSDEGPKPSKEWSYPSAPDLAAWVTKKGAAAFSLTELLKNPMPLYMFSRYCKEEGGQSTPMMFVEDVCRYRRLYGDVARKAQSNYMMENYAAAEGPASVDMVESEMSRNLKKDISESDVAALVAECGGKGTNATGVGGSAWADVESGISGGTFNDDLWDKVEAVVFNKLLDAVEATFRAHPFWEKMCSFLYLQEANVDEDDFALFRVLGRGGFGMVNGCKKCTSGKLYAMKVMNKKRVKIKRSEQVSTRTARALHCTRTAHAFMKLMHPCHSSNRL